MSNGASTDPACAAVVGLGFSGAAVAIHLLHRLPAGSRLVLIETSARVARGVAYGTHCASHWLNVPAGRLGLDPAHESGFVEWLRAHYGGYSAADFVPRMLLGDYLHESLGIAEQQARGRGVVVQHLSACVDGVELPRAGARTLRLAGGEVIQARQVVLATGHLPPELPRLPGDMAWGSPGLIAEPWDDGALSDLPEDGDVLLLGSGLSAIDLLTWLQDRGHAGRVTMLSRRGLLPQPHRTLEARPRADGSPLQVLANVNGLRAMLAAVRAWAADTPAERLDWRDVMASLRGATPALWQRLTVNERRQFLRHLQPWWDTHRHRLAPGIQQRMQAALRSGQAEVRAGRLRALRPAEGGGFVAGWVPRGSAHTELAERRVAAVVNCTGPSSRVGHACATPAGGLLASLHLQGRLAVDDLGLGLLTDTEHRLLDARGRSQEGLYYVGPMLKAQHWEAIAIPELRVHARAVAEHLMQQLPAREAA